MPNFQLQTTVFSAGQSLFETMRRQFCFPSPLRAGLEVAMFCGVFLAAAIVSPGVDLGDVKLAMIPVVLICMLASVASGVYRRDITNSIMNIYLHSVFGFVLYVIGCLLLISLFFAQLLDPTFILFFLFFSFFVSNTVRPLTSGTDFNDGGGRRTN